MIVFYFNKPFSYVQNKLSNKVEQAPTHSRMEKSQLKHNSFVNVQSDQEDEDDTLKGEFFSWKSTSQESQIEVYFQEYRLLSGLYR